ncbi:MAG: glycosyltransferase [Flavobacteriales bacterium]
MHVLFLPKWFPGRNDPQLGDFLRKQAIATAAEVKVSVLFVTALDATAPIMEVRDSEGLWELHGYYPRYQGGPAPWRSWINLWRYLRTVRQGWNQLVQQRGRPDLVHAHILLRPAVLAWWWRWRWGIPYVVSEQSSGFMTGAFDRRGRLYRTVSRFVLRQANSVSTVSAHLGARMKALGLINAHSVVPNVVPGLDRPLPAPGVPGHFLMVADLVDEIKNVSGVLWALAQIIDHVPGARLDLIGDGPDRALLERLCDELKLRDRVTFHGRLPNRAVLDHMAGCAAVIVNSRVETFSVVTGEGLAMGKPVIATRCGGPEAFITPENGILVPVDDRSSLSAAMLHVITHAGTYAPERVRASVQARSSAAAVGIAFRTLYERTLHDA